MIEKIENSCNQPGKKYIYAYYAQPDGKMHEFGCYSNPAKAIIRNINQEIEKLSSKLKDTIIIVIADHGHINVENIYLKDYPRIKECLLRTTSVEPRTINFFIKENKKYIFKNLFNESFSEDFDLYEKEEIIKSQIFGTGKENKIFKDLIGDYIAIAKTNKTLLNNDDDELKSQHSGYTDDEIYVPLIVINTNEI